MSYTQHTMLSIDLPKKLHRQLLPINDDLRKSTCFGVNKLQLPENNRVSFMGVPETLAQKIPETFLKSNSAINFFKFAERNASLFRSTVNLMLATTLRPFTVLAVPGAKEEDKQYAAVRSVVSGVLDFTLTALIYFPLAKYLEKAGKSALEALSKTGSFPYKFGTPEFKSFNYMVNMGSQIIIAPLYALILLTAIPIVVSKLFPSKKKTAEITPTPYAAKISPEQRQLIDEFIRKSGGGKVR